MKGIIKLVTLQGMITLECLFSLCLDEKKKKKQKTKGHFPEPRLYLVLIVLRILEEDGDKFQRQNICREYPRPELNF